MGLVRFRDNAAKAAYLERKAGEDVRLASVQSWKGQFASIPSEMARVRAIHRFVTHCIDYANDPRVEVLDDSGIALDRGYGDCDVKARLFVALCRACGLVARTSPVMRGGRFPHIRAEVFLNGSWMLVDPIIVNSDVGELPARGAKTSWR